MQKISIFDLEPIGIKAECLSSLIISLEQAIYEGNFNVSAYRMAFHHLCIFSDEIYKDINNLINGGNKDE